jgi:hypothetical protein
MVDGSKYRGQFIKDANIKDGIGQMIYPDGSIFEGAFADDDTVKGRYVFNNGYVYEGEMLNHKMHGKGVLRFKGRKIYSGQFQKGKQVSKELDLTSTVDISDFAKLTSSKSVKFVL